MIKHRPLAIAFLSAACSAAIATPEQNEYAKPHQQIEVEGRHLNLFCMGSGSPTIIFESGAGVAGWGWQLVQPTISKKNRACTYDRAGLGFSEPSPLAGTSVNAVNDLHKLLSAAGLHPPFVLVGHSYGGMNVQLFAYRYPSMVSGLVLVEAQHEDERERLDRVSQGKLSLMTASLLDSYRKCTDASKLAFQPPAEPFAACVGEPYKFAKGPFSKAYTNQFRKPTYWEAHSSELEHLYTSSSEQLRSARKAFGSLPVACLIRSVSPYMAPGSPPTKMSMAAEQENDAMQREVASLSSSGNCKVVPGAGHDIAIDRPQAVIQAIREVLKQQAK